MAWPRGRDQGSSTGAPGSVIGPPPDIRGGQQRVGVPRHQPRWCGGVRDVIDQRQRRRQHQCPARPLVARRRAPVEQDQDDRRHHVVQGGVPVGSRHCEPADAVDRDVDDGRPVQPQVQLDAEVSRGVPRRHREVVVGHQSDEAVGDEEHGDQESSRTGDGRSATPPADRGRTCTLGRGPATGRWLSEGRRGSWTTDMGGLLLLSGNEADCRPARRRPRRPAGGAVRRGPGPDAPRRCRDRAAW